MSLTVAGGRLALHLVGARPDPWGPQLVVDPPVLTAVREVLL